MTTTTGKAADKATQRSMEARLGQLGRDIDQVAQRAAASRAEVRARMQRELDQLRQRQAKAAEHLRRQKQADQAAWQAYTAELAWDLDELDVDLAIAEAALAAELAPDAATFDAAVQAELDAWNDWIGLLQAKAARETDNHERAEALTRPVQQRATAAANQLHHLRAGRPGTTGHARDSVELAMIELRAAADEAARQADQQFGDRPSTVWPAPTASRVRGTRTRPAPGGTPRWLTGQGWPAPGWTIAYGILTLAAGVLVLVWPGRALIVLAIVLGIQLLVAGVFWLVSAFAVPDAGMGALAALSGVLGILLGLLVVSRPAQALGALILLLGLFWTVSGLIQIVHGIRTDTPARGWTIAAGVIGAAAGITLLVYPGPSLLVLALIFGIGLILYGAFLIAEGVQRRQRRHVTVPAQR